MRRIVALTLACLSVWLGACDGIGRPVVGDRPFVPGMNMNACFAVPCDSILEALPPRWRATADLGVAGAGCAERSERTLTLADMPTEPGTPIDLRCTDATVRADAPFAIDLRNAALGGARLTLLSEHAGSLALAGTVANLELTVVGPIDVEMSDGALSTSVFVLEGSAPDRLATLTTRRVVVSEVAVRAPHGHVRTYESTLARVEIDAVEVTLEVSAASDGRIEADRMAFLDSRALSLEVGVDRFIVAAGELDRMHIHRCGEVTFAAVDVSHTRIERCASPLLLNEVDLDGSVVHADVRGLAAQIRRTAFHGERVVLVDSRMSVDALCGVEVLDVTSTAVECPTCEPAAPPEICGAPAIVQPYCPGFELSPCEGQPRPEPESLVDIAP